MPSLRVSSFSTGAVRIQDMVELKTETVFFGLLLVPAANLVSHFQGEARSQLTNNVLETNWIIQTGFVRRIHQGKHVFFFASGKTKKSDRLTIHFIEATQKAPTR